MQLHVSSGSCGKIPNFNRVKFILFILKRSCILQIILELIWYIDKLTFQLINEWCNCWKTRLNKDTGLFLCTKTIITSKRSIGENNCIMFTKTTRVHPQKAAPHLPLMEKIVKIFYCIFRFCGSFWCRANCYIWVSFVIFGTPHIGSSFTLRKIHPWELVNESYSENTPKNW